MTVTFIKNGLDFGNVSAPDMVSARKWAAAEGCIAVLPSSKAAEAARLASRKAEAARLAEAGRSLSSLTFTFSGDKMTATFPRTFSSRADVLFYLAELFGVCASVIDEATGVLDFQFDTEQEFSAFKADVWEVCFPGVEYQG